jgi:hypothetical protein
MTDSILEKIVRLAIVSEKLADDFGTPHEHDRGRPYGIFIEGNARVIREELATIADGMTHEHPQFGMFKPTNYVE